jgi:AcrR family transcriptional regulator
MTNSGSAIIQQRILAAATELFATSGYNGVSTREIARAAEVNETSIYRYYLGKRELFLATLDAELSKVQLNDEQIAKLLTAPDAHAAVLALFQVMIEGVQQRRELIRLIQFSVLEYNDDLEDLYRRHIRQILQHASEYLARWPELGETQAFDRRVTIFAFIAAFIALKDFYPKIAGDSLSQESMEVAASSCARVWEDALATKPAESNHTLLRSHA